MKKPLKTKSIEYMDFWNEDYDIRIYFKEREVTPPEPIIPDIPTNLLLKLIVDEPIPPQPIIPEIPTNLLLTEVLLSLPEIPTSINAKNYANS